MEGAEWASRQRDQTKMERAEQASRQTDELRMKVYMRLLLSILCTRPMNEDLIKCLGLDLSMTYDGITPLKFISKDSLLKLKAACDTTKLEDLLQHLFVESEAVDVLGRGKVKFKMFMCMMSPEEYGRYSQIKGKLTEEREDEDQKMLSLFVEELHPNKLFEDLWNMNLVGENDKEEVMNCIPRQQRMEFLIGRLNHLKRNKMLNILLAHSMKHDYCYLWRKIIDIYGGDTGNSHLTGRRGEDKSITGEKVFTADFTLSIQESTGALKVDIQNRKWHLDTDEAVMKEIVIMGIIPESTEENPVTTEFPDAKWKTVQIVKNIECLKREMERTDILYIADRLYSDFHLDQDELEHIQYCTNNQPRRKAIDRLLKTVMLGNPLILPAFMHILQTNSHLSFITETINSTDVSPAEMQRKLTEEREDEEQKILSLFVEELDSHLLFEDLRNMHLVGENDREFNILLVHCIKHDNLWKKISDMYSKDAGNSNFTGKRVEDESVLGQKLFTANLSTQATEGHSTKQSQKDMLEKRVVSTVNSTKGRNRLSAQSEKLFGKKFHRAYQKCIVLHFEHNEGDSLDDLKRVCNTERNIKEFVHGVFEGTGIENILGEGDFKWNLSMLLMQVNQPNLESLARVFDPLNGSSKDDIFKICVEELDPRILCKDAKQEGVLDQNDEAEMLGKTSRMDRMLFLMDKLAHKPNGYKVLMKHCMMYNKYVIQKLEENEITMSLRNHMNTVSSQADAQSSSDIEVLYTVTVVMKIKAKEQTTYRKSGTQDQTICKGSVASEEYEITCSHILDPAYYFDDVVKNRRGTPQKDLFMVLQSPFEEEGNVSFFKTGTGRELYASEVVTYMKSTITSQIKEQRPKRRKIKPIDEKRHLKRKRSMHDDDAAS